MKRLLGSAVLILAVSALCSAQNTFYLPQVADGFAGSTAWITAIAITNTAATGTALASGTITLTQDNGTPWSVSFNDDQGAPAGSGSSISFQVAGGQTRAFVSTGNQPLKTGFAVVTSNLPVGGGAVFIEFGGLGLVRIAQAGVPASSALTRQTTIASRTNHEDTAIAIANPSNSGATITFQLLDRNGSTASASVNRSVVAKGHTAFFVSELFPGVPPGFFGTLQVTSGTAIATIALLFEDTGQFATLPVLPLP